jgi:hypothetical protein
MPACLHLTRKTHSPHLWNVTRSRMPASTSRSVCVAGDGVAMCRIIPHAPGVWRARMGGNGRSCGPGAESEGFGPSICPIRGKGIPTFRLRN